MASKCATIDLSMNCVESYYRIALMFLSGTFSTFQHNNCDHNFFFKSVFVVNRMPSMEYGHLSGTGLCFIASIFVSCYRV